jgi:hypothetical protein
MSPGKKVNEESYVKLYPRPRREEGMWRDGGEVKTRNLGQTEEEEKEQKGRDR